MEVGSAFVAGSEPFELVEPCERPLDDPARAAEPGPVGDAAACDQGLDAALPQETAVLVEVVATVGEQSSGSVAGSSAQASDAGYRVQERDQLRDVVPVSAGHGHSQRGPVPVHDHMVLGPRPCAVDRRGADMISPFERPDVGAVDCTIVHVQGRRWPVARSAGPRGGAARRQPRSSPEADARPSPPNSPRCPRERRARRHRFAARTSHPRVLPGPEREVARDGVGAAPERAEAEEPHGPTDRPEQDQNAPHTSRQRSPKHKT